VEKVVEYPIPLETSKTKGMVAAVEFPLPLKEETTAGAVVECLEVAVVEYLEVVAVGGSHPEVEEEKEKRPEVWGDPGEDLWAA
jgi:hypothetical protein